MYTRSFYGEDSTQINIPDNYNGTALREGNDNEFTQGEQFQPEEKNEPTMSEAKRDDGFLGIFKNLPFGRLFEGNGIFRKNMKIGTEELILIGVAALLFFGKNGDKDCALWLFLLLFI